MQVFELQRLFEVLDSLYVLLLRRITKGHCLAQHKSDLCENSVITLHTKTLKEKTSASELDHCCCNAHNNSVDVSSRRSEGFGTNFFPTMVLYSVAQAVS